MLSTENAKQGSELVNGSDLPQAANVSTVELSSAIRFLAEGLSDSEKERFKNLFPALYGREK